METEQNRNEQDRMPEPGAYQTPLHSMGSSILYLTNPEPIIQELVLTLKSQYRDENGNIIQKDKPLLNDHGINMIVGYVRSLMNQVTIMSNLDENEINRLIMRLADSIIKDLMVNKDKYEIESDTKRSFVVDYVTAQAYVAMKRAIAGAGNEKSFWKGSQQEITYKSPDEKKKSMWSFLGDW